MKTPKPHMRLFTFCDASSRSMLATYLAALTLILVSRGQEVPYEAVGDQTISTNVSLMRQNIYPGSLFTASEIPARPSGTNFNMDMSNFVPDCSGAVSSSNIVTMINFRFRVHDKATYSSLANTTLTAFWSQSTNTGNWVLVYDPVIVFDPHARRFIATAATDSGEPEAAVLVGVSLTEDPLGSWNLRRVQADTNQLSWGDQPHIGFNDRLIVISVNMFQNSTNFDNGGQKGAKFFVFDKTNMYAGNYSAPSTLSHTNKSIWPACNYDAGSTNLFLLQNVDGTAEGENGNEGELGLGTITGSPSDPILNFPTHSLRVKTLDYITGGSESKDPEFRSPAGNNPQGKHHGFTNAFAASKKWLRLRRSQYLHPLNESPRS